MANGYVPVEVETGGDAPSAYVTDLTVIRTMREVFVQFFQVHPSTAFGPVRADMAGAKAECVARIVFTPDRLEDFIRALQGSSAQPSLLEESSQEEP